MYCLLDSEESSIRCLRDRYEENFHTQQCTFRFLNYHLCLLHIIRNYLGLSACLKETRLSQCANKQQTTKTHWLFFDFPTPHIYTLTALADFINARLGIHL